jgi:hypothetical protein
VNGAAIQDIRRIWRVTTVLRDERTMLVLGWLAVVCAILGEMGAGLAVAQHNASPLALLRVLSGVGAFWLGFAWATLFVPASILLNSPANARLVPRQRLRLIQMSAASWLLITAGITFTAGEWAAFPAVGLSLIAFALMRAGRNEATLLFIIGINWSSLSRHVLPPVVVNAVAGDAGLLVLSIMVLPADAWALRSLYPAAGDKHLAGRGEQAERMAKPGQHEIGNLGPVGRLGRGITARIYNAMLRRDLHRPRPGAMLTHALGSGAHWSVWLASMISMPLVSLVLRLLLTWRGEASLRAFVDGPMGAGMAAMTIVIVFSTATLSQRIRKTTGEQSLLRLAPLVGDAALLNRRLALELLRHALRSWFMLTVAVLLSTAILDTSGATLLRQAALCVLAGQMATVGLLGDFAGEGGWNVMRAVQAGLLAVCELFIALGLDRISGVSIWIWVAAIAVIAGAWQLRRSWSAMLAAPPAFPAGRTV